jgi:hypothetical protein
MKERIAEQIAVLKDADVEELQAKHKELFGGQEATSDNKVYLIRRIAYRLQELEYGSARPEANKGLAHHSGGLSEKAQKRLNELITLHDPVNNKAMRPEISMETGARKKNVGRDRRLPIPGSVIVKEYRGKKIEVKVLENSFEYNGKIHKTLTAIAEDVTGAHWNGYLFFNL